MTKPTTSYGVPAKVTTQAPATSKTPTNTGNPGKNTTGYYIAGSEGGVLLGDLTVLLSSLVVTLGDGANSTRINDKETTPATRLAKVTTGYSS